jgi:hypothetical protein
MVAAVAWQPEAQDRVPIGDRHDGAGREDDVAAKKTSSVWVVF